MKRFTLILTIWLAGLGMAKATTYYVDAACPTAGNGTSATCSSSPTTNNPKKTVATGIALLSAAGDILNVRGIHAAHNTGGQNCPGDTEGRYFFDVNDINGKNGAAGNPIIIQASGWTANGARTQEYVFLEPAMSATDLGAADWQQCSDCSGVEAAPSAGTPNKCPGVPLVGGVCTDTWWITKAVCVQGGGAIKPLGDPAFRVSALADMDNTNAAYNAARCSNELWRPCTTAADCVGGGSCTAGASPEIDSYTGASWIYTRWGTGANAPGGGNNLRPYLISSCNGTAFRIQSSSYITIRGFVIRNNHNYAVEIQSTNDHITVQDNVFAYHACLPAGSDYGIGALGGGSGGGPANTIIDNNEFFMGGSEPIHTAPKFDGTATLYTITNNFIHDTADRTVVGPAIAGTPTCSTLSDSSTTPRYGNYTGSIIDGNIFSGCTYLNLENFSDGWAIRNNIIKNTTSACIYFDPSQGITGSDPHTSNNQVYNNLLISCGTNAIEMGGTPVSTATTSGNSIYNNTIINPTTYAINGCNPGTCANNIFRNNILYTSGSGKMVNWTNTTAGNIFDYNLVVTSANPAVTWQGDHTSGGPGYSCAQLSTIAAGNVNNCPDPVFINSSTDFHIQTSSPAKDLGTSTGMPSGKTRSLNNPLASRHSMPQYNGIPQVGSAWDIGACEYRKRRYYSLSEFEWKRPEPWRITNAAFLRLKKEMEN